MSFSTQPGAKTSGPRAHPSFIRDYSFLVRRTVVIASGEGVLKAGSVLGQVTANSKYRLSIEAETDGSQTVDLILAEDVDATADDVTVGAYAACICAEGGLTFGTGHDADSTRETLRAKGIYLEAGGA